MAAVRRLRRGVLGQDDQGRVPDQARGGEVPEGAEAVSAAQSLPAGLGTAQVQQPADDADDAELAKYNAYLARLNDEVKGTHGKRYGFR